MTRKQIFLSISFLIIGATIGIVSFKVLSDNKKESGQSILGNSIVVSPTSTQTHFSTLPSEKIISPLSTTEPIVHSSVTTAFHEISLISAPKQINEGDNAAFTWQITGPKKTIRSTTVYYGTSSFPGTLTTTIAPDNTSYTDSLKDFIDGNFSIPLRFVGNTTISSPGVYQYRVYGLIDGKHYWGPEESLIVKALPKHEIKVEDRPNTVFVGGNVAFTWDIYGPAGTTGYTAIVGGKQSKPGPLDTSVDLSKTPYTVFVNDFTSGTYQVPLRYIGNMKMTEQGQYYFRALAFINGKNIWSDEYSYTVQ